MRQLLLLFAPLLWSPALRAQQSEVYSDRIQSLQVVAADNWQSMPVAVLGQDDIHIAFDDLTHEYRRYTYRLEHCEADWTVSKELFASDYCEGFSEDVAIDDVQESLNTNVLYTHYRLTLPNDQCRIKLAGNYRLTITDENDGGRPVLQACFMVVQPLVGLSLAMTTNTDAGINSRYQQVEMELSYGSLTVTNPGQQLKTVVLQNGRWDNAVWNSKPQYVMANGLRWSHDRNLIFPGGNEYRKFEMLDVDHTSMGLEKMDWDGTTYHAYVETDEPRPNYVYDESANGSFYIRNSDNVDNDTQSDYLQAHFTLKSPRLAAPVYLNGAWTLDRFLPRYEMQWDEKEKAYNLAVMLKQGYYSYTYLTPDAGGVMSPVPSEGNFYQTRNRYEALVYYRGVGERTDRLVAFAELKVQ